MSKAGSQTAQREGRTDENGVTDLVGGYDSIRDGGGRIRKGDGLANLGELRREDLAILRCFNHRDLGSHDLDVGCLELAGVPELQADVQCGLASHGYDDPVWLFLRNDLHNDRGSDGLKVDAVGTRGGGGGLDGSNIGVDEHGLNSFLLERLDALGSRVIELSGLANGEAAGSDEEDFLVGRNSEAEGVEEGDGL